MIINTNMASLNTVRQLGINEKATQSSLAKLSSGLRINTAADDAAGLAISEKMRGQISGLNKAQSNAQDGISLASTAEGALNETTSILQRMRELAVQGSNDTATTTDRAAMQTEVGQLKSEIDRIANATQFNTKTLLNGSLAGASSAQGTKTDSLQLSAFARITADTAIGTGDQSGLNGKNFTINGVTVTIAGLTTASGNTADQNAQAIASSINGTAGIGVTASTDGAGKVVLVGKTAGQNETVTAGTATLANVGMGTNNTGSGAVSNNTLLTDLTNTSGVSLGIQAGDVITSAVTTGGTANSSHNYTVTATSKLSDLFSDITTNLATVSSASLTNTSAVELHGLDVSGLNGALSNVTISAANGGTARTTFNNQFSSFIEVQAAKDQHTDSSLTFQIGANQGQTMSVGINEMDTKSLSLSGVDVSTLQGAQQAITAVDNAINKVSTERANLGAVQNRLEHTINNLGTSSQNITSAEASIRDVDMAKEMTNFQKNNILQQAAQAMLAQANQQPQGVLQLLR